MELAYSFLPHPSCEKHLGASLLEGWGSDVRRFISISICTGDNPFSNGVALYAISALILSVSVPIGSWHSKQIVQSCHLLEGNKDCL